MDDPQLYMAKELQTAPGIGFVGVCAAGCSNSWLNMPLNKQNGADLVKSETSGVM